MQPQDPMQPQQPPQPQPPFQPPAPGFQPAPAPMQQPQQPLQQPVAMPVQAAPVMQQPAMPVGQPMQQYGMPMQPLPADKRSIKKALIGGAIAVVVAVGVFVGITLLKSPYPTYKEAKTSTYNGYTVAIFDDWTKKEESTGSEKVVSYTDYVDDKAKNDNNVHAQQVILVQEGAIPKSKLVAEVKQEIISEFTKNDDFLKSISGDIKTCATIENQVFKSTDSLTIKNAFVVFDFSFSCPTKNKDPAINAVGRVIISTDGSLGITLIAATKKVYEKNATIIDKAVKSVAKQ